VFSYYGSKSRVVHLYPKPTEDLIIEPFAGSAKYALRYCDKHVWLNDAYPVIAEVWQWIQQATRADIERLPELKRGEDLRDFKQLSETERNVLGFAVGRGNAAPRHICSKWSEEDDETAKLKRYMLHFNERIKHWKITCLDYRELPNERATWFVDPPYQVGGERYKVNGIDYQALADWCRTRNGQTIVCENEGGTWLPFKPLRLMQGIRRNTVEAIWLNSI
jgi:site-specific DNA-adenine methylase